MKTKTHKLRRESKNYTFRLIHSESGAIYALFTKDYMVNLHDRSDNGVSAYATNFIQSLPWSVVRRIVKRGGSGFIRDAWTYSYGQGSIRIGCQRFTGVNRAALIAWAEGR